MSEVFDVRLGEALEAAGEFADPEKFQQLGEHLDPAWIEETLARDVWAEIPENSLTIVDRNFLVKKGPHPAGDEWESALALAVEDKHAGR